MERVEAMNGLAAFLEPVNILLLEDNAADVDLLSAILLDSDIACRLTVVDHRAAFLSTLNTQPVDIVLSDYSLPDFDGLSAIALVKDSFPDVPCILVSGVLGEDRAVGALKSGATDYILKQNLDCLVPAVKRALREQQERRALLQATADLQDSETRFRTSVETMADCFMLLPAVRDSEGFIQDFTVGYLNSAACKYLSVSQSGQVGNPLYTVIPAFKNTAREKSKRLEKFDLFLAFCGVIETGYPFSGELICNAYQLSDQFVVVDIRVAKLDDELVVTWRDVTEKKQDEQRYLQLLATADSSFNQVEQANQFRDVFLGNLSHELRSPLSTIMGWLEISGDHLDNEALLSRAIQTSYHNAELIDRLIQDLLDVSRLPYNGLECDLESLSLDRLVSLVSDIVETSKPAARNKNIEITLLPLLLSDSSRGSILGNFARLQQVFRNLISNALKFTPAGGQISVSLEQTADLIAVSVQDTGIGISSAAMPHIFERFWQGGQSSPAVSYHRFYGGLGLGLPIVSYIVEAHGGQVSADSAGFGKGSCFKVDLPLASKQILSEADSAKASASEPLEADSLAGCRVLIFEDNPDGLEVYTFMLEAYGATVEAALSADAGLKIFREFQPDVLVSDLVMPGKSGYELIREIRSLPAVAGGSVPAIALTALSEPQYRTQALLAGFQQHVVKPIELQEMAAIVSKLYRLSST
ncbi:response regulator [cf. Phormidesmis sp. LEGE 11477]|uniref:ATP-binding response regulator n=1 Tax=cf. Phormidesmis sp. LEGE 11477 TaxID=1828680 RepID=UPI001881F774|nr:response regulator [cf. Phormidesmis sp. LEGE 11477]MBE9061977.1 response regulator [cf. Phormidesmis sp. LEGE 11477]